MFRAFKAGNAIQLEPRGEFPLSGLVATGEPNCQ